MAYYTDCMTFDVPSTPATLFTVPVGEKWVVHTMRLTNTTSGSVTFSMYASPSGAYLAYGLPVRPYDTLSFVTKSDTLVLEASDSIVAGSSVGVAFDLYVSYSNMV